jgi:hypothetical protein
VNFYKRITRLLLDEKIPVVIEPKVDGVAVSVMYHKDRLKYAATRGDGFTGEDVTANVRTIKDIPQTLPKSAPDLIEVRGEIYLRKEDFQIYEDGVEQNVSYFASVEKPFTVALMLDVSGSTQTQLTQIQGNLTEAMANLKTLGTTLSNLIVEQAPRACFERARLPYRFWRSVLCRLTPASLIGRHRLRDWKPGIALCRVRASLSSACKAIG